MHSISNYCQACKTDQSPEYFPLWIDEITDSSRVNRAAEEAKIYKIVD